jgi:hypothetical protein
MTGLELVLVIVATALAFLVSASAGLGGSLILVPALALVLGTKEGVALAALLLAANNVVKIVAYRRTLPLRASAWVVLATIVGAWVGARALVAAPTSLVTAAVIASIVASFVVETRGHQRLRRGSAPVLALGAGLTSGFSGASGPLKGLALRALSLDRTHLVGAAALVSFAGDAAKTTVFADAGLLGAAGVRMAVLCVPLMLSATFAGRRLNRELGERGYSVLFWSVLAGYGARLVLAL